MKHLITGFVLFLLTAGGVMAFAQEVYDGGEYTLELPSPVWKVITEPDAAHEHAEFVNGDRLEGYLQIRKEVVDAGTTPSDVARRDLDQKLRFLPGVVEGKEEKVSGRLSGGTGSHEFINTAKTM